MTTEEYQKIMDDLWPVGTEYAPDAQPGEHPMENDGHGVATYRHLWAPAPPRD